MNESTGRILALDVGDRRIGVAVSDPGGIIALPLQVLNRDERESELEIIADLVREKGAELLLVGYPKSLDGTAGAQAGSVDKFIEKLRSAVTVDIKRWDERLTTKAAEKDLIRAGNSRRERRKRIDIAAATLILQSYLESRRGKSSRDTSSR